MLSTFTYNLEMFLKISKEVIRSSISKNDIQDSWQKKKDKSTNNDLQNNKHTAKHMQR